MHPFRAVIGSFLLIMIISCAGGPQVTTHHRPGAYIEKSSPIAVVPAKMGRSDDLILPDAIATELIGLGLNIVERTTLSQMVKERGLDLTEILNGEEYFKLGEITNVEKVVIVNSKLLGVGVANATVRVVDTKSGEIILSTTYTQPRADQPVYVRHHDLIDTAKEITKSIESIVK